MQNQKKIKHIWFFAKCQLFVLMIILICFHFLFFFAGLGGSNPTSTTLGSCDFINHMI